MKKIAIIVVLVLSAIIMQEALADDLWLGNVKITVEGVAHEKDVIVNFDYAGCDTSKKVYLHYFTITTNRGYSNEEIIRLLPKKTEGNIKVYLGKWRKNIDTSGTANFYTKFTLFEIDSEGNILRKSNTVGEIRIQVDG